MKRILILLSLLISIKLSSQSFTQFTHYSVANGLSENNVVCMLQDRKGNMWFGTYDGLNKFDGYSFKRYKSNPDKQTSLINFRIDRIREDNDGYIWIQTYDGSIYRFNPGTETFLPISQYETKSSKQKIYFRAVYTFDDGSIWLIGYNANDEDICYRITNVKNSDKIVSTIFHFKNKELPLGKVINIYVDRNKTTWILTTKGVNLLKSNSSGIIQIKGIGTREFLTLCEAYPYIYLGGRHGLFRTYDYRNNTIDSVKLPVKADIIDIHKLNDNELFILTDSEGFCVFNQKDKKFTLYNKSNGTGLKSNNFFSSYIDKRNNIWLNTDNPSIVYFESDKRKINNFNVSTGNSATYSSGLHFFVLEDNLGNTWVHPGKGGFSIYNRALNKLEPFYNDPKSSDRKFSNLVRTAMLDRQGNLWIAPYSFGIEKIVFRESPFNSYKPVPEQKFTEHNMVRSVFQDKDNLLWVGTKHGYLYIYDGNRNLMGKLGEDGKINGPVPFNVPVFHIMSDSKGAIWVASKGKGLYKLIKNGYGRNISFSITNYQYHPDNIYSLSSNSVYCVFEDHLKRIWVATFGGGINLIDTSDKVLRFLNNRNKFRSYPNQCLKARYITEDPKGIMYVGTTDGMLAFQNDGLAPEKIMFHHYSFNPKDGKSISGNDIHYILPAKNGNLYLAIYGGGLNVLCNGLNLNKKSEFKAYKKDNGAPSDVIFTLQEDANEEIWLSLQTQIAKFSPKTERFEIYNLPASDASNFMEAAVCKTNQGDLCYGTTEGFVMFDPLKATKSQYIPRITFTQLQLLNKPVEVGVKGSPLSQIIDDAQEIKLTHKQNMLSISFAALDYSDPQEIEYTYKLDGFDDDWNYIGNRHTATYTNLPKGKYTFRVKSTNADGQWVNNERSIIIERLPSFWESSWGLAFYVFAFVVITVLVSYIIFTIYKLKNDVAVEHHITNMKLQFFTDISHELRTPLTLIASPVENILHNETLSDRVKEQLFVVQRNTQRMLRLINQILDFRKIQHKKMKLVVEDTNVFEFVNEIYLSFNKLAEERNIDFRIVNNSNNAYLWVDRDKFEKILFNLLSNAFKFTPQGGSIEVSIVEEPEYVDVIVKDFGIGIAKEKLARLFNQFESLISSNSMQPSTGIGLSLTKELVELHKASITVDSEPDRGSAFKVTFKKGRHHFNQEVEYVLQDLQADTEQNQNNQIKGDISIENSLTKGSGSGEHTILIVEDNTELRHFIKQVLENHYIVLEARNGKEALALLPNNSPDIIISDIMMPEMSGTELAKRIKKDLNFSHIPLVLLTAKSDMDSKIEAMEYGADDYITKPFSSVYLEARIENLLKQRRQLQEYYRSSLTNGTITISKPNVTPQDDNFIQRIMEYIEENIEDPELSIDNIALYIGLSRSTMFKKMKSLTGIPPVDFIKEIRIQRAAQLIETGEFNVSQVAYMIGMTDPSYLTKCFKQKYGVTPREYKEKNLHRNDN